MASLLSSRHHRIRSVIDNDEDIPAADPRPSTRKTIKGRSVVERNFNIFKQRWAGSPVRQARPHLSQRTNPTGHQHLADSFRRYALLLPLLVLQQFVIAVEQELVSVVKA